MMKALFHFLYHLSPPSTFPNHSPFPHSENGSFLGMEIISWFFLTSKIKARPPSMSHPPWPAPLSLLGTMLIENHTGVQALSHLEHLQCLFILPGILSPQDLPWAKLCGCQPPELLLSVPGTCIPGFQVASISSCLKHWFLGEDWSDHTDSSCPPVQSLLTMLSYIIFLFALSTSITMFY